MDSKTDSPLDKECPPSPMDEKEAAADDKHSGNYDVEGAEDTTSNGRSEFYRAGAKEASPNNNVQKVKDDRKWGGEVNSDGSEDESDLSDGEVRERERMMSARHNYRGCTDPTGGNEVVDVGTDLTRARRLNVFRVMGEPFVVRDCYRIIGVCGQGSYGVVCAAQDQSARYFNPDEDGKETGEFVVRSCAIKRVGSSFDCDTHAKRTLRELRILRLLDHENVVSLFDVFVNERIEFDGAFEQDMYLVNELMETDLSMLIKSNQALQTSHYRFLSYQIVRAVKFIHSANVIHRDIKPRNILVNSNCDVKVCDFGLARLDLPELSHSTESMTDYVATRWYRAPEVIMSWKRYGKEIDIWALGCVMAEIVGRHPLFPGTDSQHQLRIIFDMLGTPDLETMQENISNSDTLDFILQLPRKQRRGADAWRYMPDSRNQEVVNLIEGLLKCDPSERLRIDEIVEHPFFSELYCADDEPVARPLDPREFEFELDGSSGDAIRDEIAREVESYNISRSLSDPPLSQRGSCDSNGRGSGDRRFSNPEF